MKIVVTADLHGYLPKLPDCDLVLICGDVVYLPYQRNTIYGQLWFMEEFKRWAENLNCKKVLWIPGNHDICVQKNEEFYHKTFPKDEKVTFLCHEYYEYEGLKIFGTPYCKIFGNWAYMLDDDELTEKFNEIPTDLDILFTHDAPYGVTDICLEQTPWNTCESLGNKPLRECILNKRPKYVFHGHLHSSFHYFEDLEGSKVINTSYVNEKYEPYYEPIVIEDLK